MNYRILLIILVHALPGLSACTQPEKTTGYTGYVEAQWRYIAAPDSGWLVSQTAIEGQQIKVGDVLFVLDDKREQVAVEAANSRIVQALAEADNLATGARPAQIRALNAKLAETQARLAQAGKDRDRVVPLVERGLEATSRRDQVMANFETAAAAVEEAKENIKVAQLAARDALRTAASAQSQVAEATRASAEIRLAERTVHAMVGGTVTEVFQYQGEFVTAGKPVLAIQPAGSLKLRFYVPQHKLTEFALGKTVNARADGLSQSVQATVSYIATEAEFTPPVIYSQSVRDKLVFLIEATLPENSGLLPGLAVDVDSHAL